MQLLVIDRQGTQHSQSAEALAEGAAGNFRTLAVAREMVRTDAAFDLAVRALALDLIARCRREHFDCEVRKLFEYARRVRFVRDPVDVERIADASTTIAEQQGDCGDKAILLSTLLGSVGYLTRWVIVNFLGDVDEIGFEHWYLEVQRADGSWIPLDPTPENKPVGWEPAAAARHVVDIWPDSGGEQDLSGILDSILPGLIQTGTQLGASAWQQSQARGAAEQQIGAQFDQMAGQVTALFNAVQAKPTITQEDVATAVQAYQQLAAVAQEYAGVRYVAEQWASASYRPAYESRLQQIAAAANARQADQLATAEPATTSTLTTLTENIFFWPVVILGLGFFLVRR